MAQQHAAALLIGDDPYLGSRGEQIVALALLVAADEVIE